MNWTENDNKEEIWREKVHLFTAAQNYIIRTYDVEAKINWRREGVGYVLIKSEQVIP